MLLSWDEFNRMWLLMTMSMIIKIIMIWWRGWWRWRWSDDDDDDFALIRCLWKSPGCQVCDEENWRSKLILYHIKIRIISRISTHRRLYHKLIMITWIWSLSSSLKSHYHDLYLYHIKCHILLLVFTEQRLYHLSSL